MSGPRASRTWRNSLERGGPFCKQVEDQDVVVLFELLRNIWGGTQLCNIRQYAAKANKRMKKIAEITHSGWVHFK